MSLTLRLLRISVVISNAAVNILRAVSRHKPLADPSIFPQNKISPAEYQENC